MNIPRFELLSAAGGQELMRATLAGRAMAVAPQAGREGSGRLGEVSGAAEARGVVRGMMLGEALARCPDLILLPCDPVQVAERWERALLALESTGAAVEPARAGLAYFAADGLRALHGSLDGTIAAVREALTDPLMVGAGPTRFCSLAAALAARSRRALVLSDREAGRWLAGRPVELLGYRAQTAELVEPLRRLGVRTLGELRKLGRAALTDRFGQAGGLAHRLAGGQDSPLRTRLAHERMHEAMEVGDASSGPALERVLGVLVSRLLARSQRRGRSLRAVTLSARLVSGGGWRELVVFRQALSDPERIWLALSLRLALLPAPAGVLELAVERFGPPASEQEELFDEEAGRSHRTSADARVREALAQVRALSGEQAALRAVCVDPDSRVPERRVVLAPIPE